MPRATESDDEPALAGRWQRLYWRACGPSFGFAASPGKSGNLGTPGLQFSPESDNQIFRESDKKGSDGADMEPSRRSPRYLVKDDAAPVVAEGSAGESLSAARRVSATDAARNFSDLINRVAYAGERFVIERGGKAMCELRSVEARRFTGADFLALLSTLARPSEEFLAAVEEITRRQDAVQPSAWEE